MGRRAPASSSAPTSTPGSGRALHVEVVLGGAPRSFGRAAGPLDLGGRIMSRYRVISGDGHLEIPPEPWIRHVPTEHRDRAPRLVKLNTGGEGWIVEGSPLIHNGQNVAAGRPLKVRGGSYWEPDGTPSARYR